MGISKTVVIPGGGSHRPCGEILFIGQPWITEMDMDIHTSRQNILPTCVNDFLSITAIPSITDLGDLFLFHVDATLYHLVWADDLSILDNQIVSHTYHSSTFCKDFSSETLP